MIAKYVIGVHIDKEPRVRCQRYYTPRELGIGRIRRFAILGEECAFEKWIKSFYDSVTIELPIRVPHYSPETLVLCIEGKRFCGHTAEVYKLRPLASRIGAKRALLLVYATAAWSNDNYWKSYVNYIVRNLRELLFVF